MREMKVKILTDMITSTLKLQCCLIGVMLTYISLAFFLWANHMKKTQLLLTKWFREKIIQLNKKIITQVQHKKLIRKYSNIKTGISKKELGCS